MNQVPPFERPAASGEIPVLIIGGGPAGLTLAIELGLRGIPCTVVEQRDGVVRIPKASLVNTRTMEYCRRWGVAEKVIAASLPPEWPFDVLFVTSVTGRELFRFRLPSYTARRRFDYSPERYAICAQVWFDPILLERARALPSVSFRFHTRFDSFTQDQNCVSAWVVDVESGRSETLTARYMVACDGPDSRVRQCAALPMPPIPPLNYNMNIFFRAPDLVTKHRVPQGQLYRVIGPKGSWGNVTAVNGRELWRLTVHLRDMPNAATFDTPGHIRRAIGPDVDFEVISAAAWERREVVADRYRDRRVFLAGDAAHQLSTTGGFGMNTSIGDAMDLAWMLAGAIEGWAGSNLLDSYELERRPIALRNIRESSGSFRRQATLPSGAAIDEDSPEGDALRRNFVDAIHKFDIRRQFEVEGVALGYRYDDSPLICPDGTPAPPDETMTYTQTARPGSRAPHGWLPDGRSMLDLFGNEFVLLRFGEHAEDAAAFIAAARTRNLPLRVIDIADAAIAGLYERRFVLVRPDGHVAWRGDRCGADEAGVIDIVRGTVALAGKVAAA